VKQDIPVILKQVDEAFTAYEHRLKGILGSQTKLDWFCHPYQFLPSQWRLA
jgi:oligopeptidase A